MLQNFAQMPSAETIAVIKGRVIGETPCFLFFDRAKLHCGEALRPPQRPLPPPAVTVIVERRISFRYIIAFYTLD